MIDFMPAGAFIRVDGIEAGLPPNEACAEFARTGRPQATLIEKECAGYRGRAATCRRWKANANCQTVFCLAYRSRDAKSP
jgi:hypothetical protein